jgi:hypothetical protein
MRLYLKKKKNHKKRAAGGTQGGDPDFKPQYGKKRKKEKLMS